MNIWENLKTSITTLTANKLRSLLTMLGVIIGVSSVILLVSIGNGLKTYVTGQLEDLGANTLFVMPGQMDVDNQGGRGGIQGAGASVPKFTFEQVNSLKKEAETIKVIMPYTENNGTMKYKGKTHITQVAGVNADYPELRDHKTVQGSFFTNSQYNSAKKVAVLGKTVSDELFDQNYPIGKRITISGQSFIVLGVLEEKGAFGGVDMDNQVFIPTTTAMKQFDMEYIQSLWIQSQSSVTIEQTKIEIEKILGRYLKKDEFSVLDTKSILNVVGNVLGTLTAALAGIAAISLLVGGIGIMNIMLVSVTERTKEIGLRKAVGATPQAILIQFLVEAVILSFVGGTIGILIGVAGALVISHFFTTTITAWCLALAFSVSALVGIIFGVLPARKAAKLNPIDALRYE